VAIGYSFASGLISGTSMAVYMGLTAPIVAGTQFTGYMALKNFVYSYSSAWQGKYADTHGYAKTLFLDGWIAFLPLLLFPFLLPSRLGKRDDGSGPDGPGGRPGEAPEGDPAAKRGRPPERSGDVAVPPVGPEGDAP
jgi:hypothetical protein